MRDFDIWDLEFMASRFNAAIPTNDAFLDQRYEWQKNDNGVEWPYYRFFYHLSKMLRPSIVLEIGGYQGTAAAHFAAGWAEGKVLTVDHHSDPGDEHNQELMFECQERYPNLVYLQGWSTAKAAAKNVGKHALGDVGNVYNRVIDHTLYFSRKIDILFIDGWHHYEYAKDDFDTYKGLLASPALVICDDVLEGEETEAPVSGMMRFWEEMPEPKFLNSSLYNNAKGGKIGFVKYGS